MCEQADKIIAGAIKSRVPATGPAIWQCFDVDHGTTPNVPVVLVTNNFGPHKAVVGRSVMMCEAAKKVDSTGNAYNANHQGEVYQCYKLGRTSQIEVSATLVTRNFANDAVRIRQPNLMCEPARKQIIFFGPNDIAATPPDDD